MIKYKWPCFKFLFLIVPLLYGCSSTYVSTLPPYKPKEPKPEIVIPESIMSELNKFKVRPWKYVVIHHSATDSGDAASIGEYHRDKKGWVNGLGYHFLIGNGNGSRDGQIEVGNRWDSQIDGAHAGNDEYNKHGVGICLVGNFENDYPTSLQISSLTYLINYLQEYCNIPRNQVKMHKDFRGTACPGRLFPYNKVIASLR
jgi:N-acetyl-anhydromuramyl-L-alanine amidase AmpD